MKKLHLLVFMLLATASLMAQRTVTGTITDSDGEALIGANIVVKGQSAVGTVTDIEGNYSLKVPEGYDVLTISYTGYSTEDIALTASNVLDFTMRSGVILDELVVTALGISREEKSLGYAVQEVNADEISKTQEANLINSLSGRVAGVQINNSSGAVGSSSRITLRGTTSLTGNNEPLFVVDGVPIDNANYGNADAFGGTDLPNGVADLAPGDIESMSVLKGPNAAALYGLRAANGAIIITTKSGKGNKGLGISFNSSVTWEDPLLLPEFQNSYGQGGDPTYFEFNDGQNGDGGIDESWGPALDAGYEFKTFETVINGDGKPTPWVSNPDNIKNFYETGMTTNNSVAFTGGNEAVNFRLAMGQFNQKGIVPNTDLTRYNISGKMGLKIADKLTATMGVQYINSHSDNLVVGGYDNENPVQQMIWSGRQVDLSKLIDYENLPLAAEGTAAEGTPLNWNTVFQNNPYWVLHTNLNGQDKDRVVGNVGLKYDITDNFYINATVGADAWNGTTTARKAKGSNNAAEGSYREVNRDFNEVNTQVLAGYQRNLNDDFSFSFTAGVSRMDRKYNRIIGQAPQLELPGLYTLANVKSGVSPIITSFTQESRINSVLGFGQIGYKGAIYLDFTGRNDWSSVLPDANNSFFYPSATVSIVATELMDLPAGHFLSFLKVRGGWSKVGSIGALQPYQLTNAFQFRTDSYGGIPRIVNPNTLNNPNLKPETTSGYEFGIDGRFLNNKVSVDFTYYNQTSKDLITNIEVSGTSGSSFTRDNIGEMSNRGIELQLSATVFERDDFFAEIGINFAKNKNEVVSLGDVDALTLGGQWDTSIEAREGLPYGVIVGHAFAKDPSGNIIHVNGLPQTDPEIQVLGNVQPDWTGGVKGTIGYKAVTLSALVDVRKGSDIHSMSTSWGRYAGVFEETLIGREDGIVGDGVKEIGDGVYAPNDVIVGAEQYNKAAFNNNVTEGAVFDASFVKLREVSLTYRLPNKIMDKKVFTGASISLIGRNLAILHKNAPHIDPETAFSSNNGGQGMEFGQIPSTRSVGFNVSLNF